MPPSSLCRTAWFTLPNRSTLSGKSERAWAPPAFLAGQSRLGDRLGHGQQILQIQGRMPAGVVLAVPRRSGHMRALAQPVDRFERLQHLVFMAHDADFRLHHHLQLVLNRKRILALAAPLEGRHGPVLGVLDLLPVDAGGSVFSGETPRRIPRRACRRPANRTASCLPGGWRRAGRTRTPRRRTIPARCSSANRRPRRCRP